MRRLVLLVLVLVPVVILAPRPADAVNAVRWNLARSRTIPRLVLSQRLRDHLRLVREQVAEVPAWPSAHDTTNPDDDTTS